MALPTTFGPLTAAQLVQLDNNFNAVAAMGITACTAVSANTISLTPLTNQPAVSAYANYQQFGFVAALSSTSGVTAAVGTLPFINVYLADGVTQAANGNIQASEYYTMVYNAALNGGVGGFQLLSQMAVSQLLDSIPGASAQGTILYRGPSSWSSLAPGTSGQVLQSQGSGANLAWANASGGGTQIVRVVTFASAGSFSFSSVSSIAATTVVKVTLVGGGGGGGGSATVGGGGGAGALAIAFISGLSANTVYSGNVGMGGNGGGATTAGSAGGTTTVSFGGVQFTAAGGGGGLTSGVGGAGGTATNATLIFQGEIGWAGLGSTVGGAGGPGPFGGGTPWQPNTATAGVAATGPGSGGGGGKGAGGGSGSPGIFLMEWVQ